jgi:hypothetical protein
MSERTIDRLLVMLIIVSLAIMVLLSLMSIQASAIIEQIQDHNVHVNVELVPTGNTRPLQPGLDA